MKKIDVIRENIKKLEDKALSIQRKITSLEMVIDKHNLLSRIEYDCNGKWKRFTFVRWDIGNHQNPLCYAVDELVADQMIDLLEYKNGIEYLTITDKGKQYLQELEQATVLENGL